MTHAAFPRTTVSWRPQRASRITTGIRKKLVRCRKTIVGRKESTISVKIAYLKADPKFMLRNLRKIRNSRTQK